LAASMMVVAITEQASTILARAPRHKHITYFHS
jgi:hypothetical protein